MRSARIRSIVLLCFLVFLDLLGKHIALRSGTGVVNFGISFGWYPSLIWQGIIVLLMCLVGLEWWRHSGAAMFSCSIILAGALGNVLSRIIWGGVVDWVPLMLGLRNNLADWYIFFGLVWWCLIQYQGEHNSVRTIR